MDKWEEKEEERRGEDPATLKLFYSFSTILCAMFPPTYLSVVFVHQLFRLFLDINAPLEFRHARAHCAQRLCARAHQLRKGGAIRMLGHAEALDGVA